MPSILPPVGQPWPTGGAASAYAVFTDTTGAILTTVDGAISAQAVDFVGIDHGIVDNIPAGANCEIFITDENGLPYKIRYGRVVRREVNFPNAATITQLQSELPLTFTDGLQRNRLGNDWVPLVGTTTLYSNPAVNDQQTIKLNPAGPFGGGISGTFTLTFNGQTTTALNYNATVAQVQAALIALTSIGAGNITVKSILFSRYTWLITFTGALAGEPQNLITLDATNLRGGAPTVTHTKTGGDQIWGVGALGTTSALRWIQPLNTDTVTVSVDLINQGAGYCGVILTADVSLTTGLVAQFDSINNVIQLGTLDAAPTTLTPQGSSTPNTVAAGPDLYTMTYDNDTGVFGVYKGLSGTPTITWTDGGQMIPHGPGYRYLGFYWISSHASKGIQCTTWAAQDSASTNGS